MGLSPERISRSTGVSLSRVEALRDRDEIEFADFLMAYGLAETSNGTGSRVGFACSVPVPCATRAARPTNTKAAAGRAVAAIPAPSLGDIKKFEAELLGMDPGIAGRPPPWSKESGDDAIRDRFAAWRTAPPLEMKEVLRRFKAGQHEGQDARVIRWHQSGFTAKEISDLTDIPGAEIRRAIRESCCGTDRHQAGAARASQPDLVTLKRFEQDLLSGR